MEYTRWNTQNGIYKMEYPKCSISKLQYTQNAVYAKVHNSLYILHRPIKIEGFTAFVLIMVCILLKKEEAVQWYKNLFGIAGVYASNKTQRNRGNVAFRQSIPA